ncbi:hypothetical protein [Photobacterium kishitanii]|uniref:Uncharacterized protein n=1 Tax=Photobacterium kishitanii TaxID=318456 RepID=A0A2T3KMD8_9GAMM|nr:hypothetical protein [Photobacterium kishitanii]PSV00963.1 hypothetical protein C9J27_02760 [Photobacterium kishitanii]
MTNKATDTCMKDIAKYIQTEKENIKIITEHVKKIELSKSSFSLNSIIGGLSPNENLEIEFKKNAIDRLLELPNEMVSFLNKTVNVEESIQEFSELLNEEEGYILNDFLFMSTLIPKGLNAVLDTKTIDERTLQCIEYYHCPICNKKSEIKIPIRSIIEDNLQFNQCPSCNHTNTPSCKCDHCTQNEFIYSIAKIIDKGISDSCERGNKMLNNAIENGEIIENNIDLTKLFAIFKSYKHSMSEDAKNVSNAIIDVYKTTKKFEQSTYVFTKNMVGEEKARQVASELNKIGFFYKKGFIPKTNDGIEPKFGTSDSSFKHLKLSNLGALSIVDTPEAKSDGNGIYTRIPNITEVDKIKIIYDIKPTFTTIFRVNPLVLEHEAFGIISSAKSSLHCNGQFLNSKLAREYYEKNYGDEEFPFLAPNIRLSRLINMDDFLNILNPSIVDAFERLEVDLVAFDRKEFKAIKIFITEDFKNLDIFSSAIAPVLRLQGIEVIILG